jgi:hypothetical protein
MDFTLTRSCGYVVQNRSVPTLRPSHTPPLRGTPLLLLLILSLLLPRTLRVNKREISRPRIRARPLAHPPLLPAKHRNPHPETKQSRARDQPRREPESPAPTTREVRVEMEGADAVVGEGREDCRRGVGVGCFVTVGLGCDASDREDAAEWENGRRAGEEDEGEGAAEVEFEGGGFAGVGVDLEEGNDH